MGLGEIRLGEMGLGEMGLGEMGQNPSRSASNSVVFLRYCTLYKFTYLLTYLLNNTADPIVL